MHTPPPPADTPAPEPAENKAVYTEKIQVQKETADLIRKMAKDNSATMTAIMDEAVQLLDVCLALRAQGKSIGAINGEYVTDMIEIIV